MQLTSPLFEARADAVPLSADLTFPDRRHTPLPLERRFENPSASDWSLSRAKRILDVMVALHVLLVFAAPMLLIAFCIRLSSRGPALFVQERMGRGGRLFRIYKFRSMTLDSESTPGPGLTRDGDRRVSSLGRWLRRCKLDELPQFYNILRGDMSMVGPRPKLPKYEAILNMPYRPGITGAATLAFRREEEMLAGILPSELDRVYARRIKPFKARLDVRYMCRATFRTDLAMIAATILACLVPARISPTFAVRGPRRSINNNGRQGSAIHTA